MYVIGITIVACVLMVATRQRASLIAIPVVYINLDRRKDRRRHCLDQLAPHFKTIGRFAAIDGSSMLEQDPRVLQFYDLQDNARWDGNIKHYRCQRMSPGEVGCSLSHLEVWSDGDDAVAIFEDDVVLERDFNSRFKTFFAALPADWDIAYLGYIDTGGLEETAQPKIRRVKFVFGAYAYMLSSRGRRKLRSSVPIDRPVDNFLGMLTETRQLQAYAAFPALATQLEFGGRGSDIRHSAHQSD